ncbi:T-cell leukemia/lymphoma protein 1B [Neophocaena asiaeorientalis asiaeorientalis]|uniref:T-cell leukemia/lymphoma protein 1B n=1 Tax=Neophocaena asiaeorientalis asiaeorientalis TaxID=1706337 RepID=A0A341CG27_NEOAA|nr:T-cell leukemia/lymphoma protein 1B [Neophocaena asiaeorientalis asiaeorientalis]
MEAEASPPLGSPPCCLWFRRPGIYEDENGRTWVTVALRISPSHRAWGRGSPGSTMPRSPSHLLVFGLPPKWELYPGRRYQATDSRLWEIVDHGQINSMGQLILKRLPSGSR